MILHDDEWRSSNEQLKQTQEMLGKLLALLESSQAEKFVAHLHQARKQYRLICERPNKGREPEP